MYLSVVADADADDRSDSPSMYSILGFCGHSNNVASRLYLAHRQSRSLPFPLQIARAGCMGFTWLRLNSDQIARISTDRLSHPNQSSGINLPLPAITSYPLHLAVDLIAFCLTTLVNAIIGEYPRPGYPNFTYSRPRS